MKIYSYIMFVAIVGLISINEGYATVPHATNFLVTVANYNIVAMEEEWRPVVGYEGYYEVSSIGRVRSLSRWCRLNNYPKKIQGKILRHNVNKLGYRSVTFKVEGSVKKCSVHRVVSLAFIDNEDNKPCINHIDCNPSNNHVGNLEWCTYKENTQHMMSMGRYVSNFIGRDHSGKNNGASKSVVVFDMDGCKLFECDTARDACKRTGVHWKMISAVCNDRRHSSGGYRFKFKSECI